MLDTINETTTDRVKRIVDGLLMQHAATAAVGLDDRLVDVGLTSMDMVNVMLAVETEFDIMVPASDITPANFRSIAAIAATVDRVLSA